MKEPQFRYFKLAVSNISKNRLFIFVISFLDYFFFGLNMFISNYYFINKRESFQTYKDDIIPLQISITHIIHSQFQDSKISIAIPFIILIIILIFKLLLFLQGIKSSLITFLYININEFFINRFLTIIFFDIISNQIVLYAKQLETNSIENFIYFVTFIIIFVVVLVCIYHHISTFYSTCSIAIDFCFNESSKNFEIVLLFLKVVVNFNVNILDNSINNDSNTSTDNNILSYYQLFLNGCILFSVILFTIYYIILCTKSSVYFIKNGFITKLRLFFLLTLSTQSIIFILFHNHTQPTYIVLSISFALLSLWIANEYNPLSFTIKKMNLSDSMEQILIIIYLTTMEKQEDNGRMYIKSIRHHYIFCRTCFLCQKINKVLSIKHSDLATETTEEINNVLDIYHNIFLKKIENEINNSKFSIFYYDFLFLIDLMRKQKSFNYQVQYLCKKIISKYKKNNELNKYINLKFVFLNFVTQNSLEESSKFKTIEEHFIITQKIIKVIRFIKRITKGKIESPKDFITLSEMLTEIKSVEIKRFLGQRENMQLYGIVLLRLIIEDVLSFPIRKEEGSLRKMKNYSEEFLEHHFIYDKCLLIEVLLKQNAFIIRKAGRALVKFVDLDISRIFPPKMKKKGIELLKELINSPDKRKTFKYITLIPTIPTKETTVLTNQLVSTLDDDSVNEKFSYYEEEANFEYYLFTFVFTVSPSINRSDLTLIGEYYIYPNDVIITSTAASSDCSLGKVDVNLKKSVIGSPVHSTLDLPYLNKHISNQSSKENTTNPGNEYIYAVSHNLFNENRLLYIKDICDFKKKFNKQLKNTIKSRQSVIGEPIKSKPTIKNYLYKRDKDGNYVIQKNNDEYSLVFHLMIETSKKIFKIYLLFQTVILSKKRSSILRNEEALHKIECNVEDSRTATLQDLNFIDGTSSINTISTSASMISMRYSQNKEKEYKLSKESRLSSYKNRFKQFTVAIFSFSLIIVSINTTSLIVDFVLNNHLITINTIYNDSRETNRAYYTTLTGLFATVCIGDLNSSYCNNFLSQKMKKLQDDADLISNPFDYLIFENEKKLSQMSSLIKQLKKHIYSLKDKHLSSLFDVEVNYQSFGLIGEIVQLSSQQIKFSSALEVLINSLTIIFNNRNYINEPVYIVNTNIIDLSNIYNISSIKEWQIEYYNSLINYRTYLLTWKYIRSDLYKRLNQQLTIYEYMSFMFVCLNYLLHIMLFSLLGCYLYQFFILVVMDIDQIIRKTKNKELNSFFLTKYNILLSMCKYYEQSPVHLIKKLDLIHKELLEAKMARLKAKTLEGLSPLKHETNTNSQIVNDVSIYSLSEDENKKNKSFTFQKYQKNFISSLYYAVIQQFITIILLSFIYFTLFFILIIVLWVGAISRTKIIIELVESISEAETSCFNDFALIQLMLLGNITEEEISYTLSNDTAQYITNDVVQAMKIIYNYEKINKKNDLVIPNLESKFELTCENFYTKINDTQLYEVSIDHPEEQYNETIIKLCSYLNLFELSDEILIYKKLFYEISQMVKRINNKSYEEIIRMIYSDKMNEMAINELFVVRQIRTWYNSIVYQKAMDDSTVYETTLLVTYLVVALISEIALFTMLYFLFFNKIREMNKNLSLLINVFKTH